MNIAMCDDDRNYRELVLSYVKESEVFSNCTIVEFDTAEELLAASSKDIPFDIILLDVEMGEINGIEAGKRLRTVNPNCIIIYISSFPKYAIDSFDNEPLHYILKPIDKDKLFEVLRKAKNKINRLYEKYNITHKDGVISIYTKDILYIEYYRKHLIFHCTDNEYETIGKVKDVVDRLENSGFILINQAVLVNARYIKQISKLDITLNNNEKLMISVRKKSDVIKYYTRYLKEVHL
ncbi:MAG: response regulator transcription factor [Clostridia bacterium]|nr:response regulator transcription factor [Clostridia bacterium]